MKTSLKGYGFTLIEMLVVVGIIGILVRGVVVKANDFILRNRVAEVSGDLYKYLLQQRNYAVVGQGASGSPTNIYFVRTVISNVGNSLYVASTQDGDVVDPLKAYPTRYIDLSVGVTISMGTGSTTIDFEGVTGRSVRGSGTSVVPIGADIRIGITSPSSAIGSSVFVRSNGLIEK